MPYRCGIEWFVAEVDDMRMCGELCAVVVVVAGIDCTQEMHVVYLQGNRHHHVPIQFDQQVRTQSTQMPDVSDVEHSLPLGALDDDL